MKKLFSNQTTLTLAVVENPANGFCCNNTNYWQGKKATAKVLAVLTSAVVLFSTLPMVSFAQTTGDFRTSGTPVTFAAATNWQTYNGTAWVAAAAAPTSADGAIYINGPHTASVTTNVTLDQVSVDGILQVNNGFTLTLADGAGDDLFVRNRLFFQATGVISGAGQLVLGNQAIVQTANVGGLAASITSTNPTLTAGASYWFNGATAQSTGFTGFASLGNPLHFHFMNPAGITIDRNLMITGDLTIPNNTPTTMAAGVTSFATNAIYNKGTFTVGASATTITATTIYNDGTFNNCVGATITPTFTNTSWRTKGIYQSNDATEPTTEASNIWTNSHKTTAHIYWMQSGNGNNRIVVLKAGSAVDVNAAIDNTTYTANAAFGTGTAIDGGFVVYNGAGSQVNVTGLIEGTTYHVAVFEYNQDCGANRNYKTGSPLTTSFVAEERPFITEWLATPDGQLTIPVSPFGETYNYTVNYRQVLPTVGGVTTLTGQTFNCIISGLTNGSTYEVSITGTFPRIHFGGSTAANCAKIRNVKQWGSIRWTSMERAFGNSGSGFGCNNLNSNATDVPNLSNVTNLQEMFARCSVFNGGNIANWNTGAVTTMSDMFRQATAFNQPIGTWNTGAVTSMQNMFAATAFNQPIGTWNTGAVTNMQVMFAATAFNQPIGTWNTGAVTTMQSMFQQATAFNQPIGTWNTGAVTTMQSMFFQATAFNQPIGTWNTGAVTNMAGMFQQATAFNQPIGTWNTGAVTNMVQMFQQATAFNQPIGTWNTGAVTSMSGMFSGAATFNQNIGTWNTGAVTSMGAMFQQATAFNQNIGTWNTGAVTSMGIMFSGATAFNQSLATWNVTNIADAGVNTGMRNMLDNCGMNQANYDATLIGWAAQNVKTGVRLGATGRVYSCGAAATARQSLITDKSWVITGDIADCISVSTTTLSAFSACLGSASAAQSYTISGDNLTANIVINAPTNFEVSVTSATAGFAGSQTLTQSGGNVGSTTVYIRQRSTAPNGASGTVTHTSTGMLTKNVSIPVSAAIAGCPTITSFLPTSGGVDTQVTITGTNFTSATAVTIGGVAARSFVVLNSTTITAITNDGFATGVITITKGGVATSATNFTRTSCTNTISITSVTATIDANNFAGFDLVWDLGANAASYTQINVFYQPQSGVGSTFFVRRSFPAGTTSGRLWQVNDNNQLYNIYIQGVCNGNAERVNRVETTIAASAGTNKPCSMPTLQPLSRTGTSITVTWSTVPNAYLYQPIYQECDANGVRVGGGGQNGTAYVTPNAHPSMQSWTASQLKPNTFYRFFVRTHCVPGDITNVISPWADYVLIQTQTGTNCVAPSPTLGAAGETNGYASRVIEWAAVPSASNGYGITFRESTQASGTTYHLGNVLTYNLSGLKQGSTYFYSVYGSCSNGQNPRSAEASFVAGTAMLDCNAATPSPSTPISAPPIGATLNWTTTPNSVQAGKLYGIIYSVVGSPNTTYAVFTDNVSQTLSQTAHQGIVANTNYNYQLQTYCDSRLQWVDNTGTFFVPLASGAERNSLETITPQGLQALAGLVDLQVYPNPTNAEVTIAAPQPPTGGVSAELVILDMLGREVYKTNNFGGNLTLNTKAFASGTYLVKVNEGGKVMTKKLVVQ
jgi:surface protein